MELWWLNNNWFGEEFYLVILSGVLWFWMGFPMLHCLWIVYQQVKPWNIDETNFMADFGILLCPIFSFFGTRTHISLKINLFEIFLVNLSRLGQKCILILDPDSRTGHIFDVQEAKIFSFLPENLSKLSLIM